MRDVSTDLAIGRVAPDFTLADTAGRPHRLDRRRGSTATVVVFTCNHCPYALAWHERIAAVARDHTADGVEVWCINPNDPERYPADAPERMRERVEREGWAMPFLHDESQAVARSFGARTTPDVFVLDRDLVLRYRGAPDGDHDDPSQDARWLRQSLAAVRDGREVEPAETEPVGCSIKWRPGV